MSKKTKRHNKVKINIDIQGTKPISFFKKIDSTKVQLQIPFAGSYEIKFPTIDSSLDEVLYSNEVLDEVYELIFNHYPFRQFLKDNEFIILRKIRDFESYSIVYEVNRKGLVYLSKKEKTNLNPSLEIERFSLDIFPTPFMPTFFAIDISYGCNLSCIYCNRKKLSSVLTPIISDETLDQIITFIALVSSIYPKNNKIYIQPFGGEPLLYPQKIYKIYDKMEQLLGDNDIFKITIQTNGTLISKDLASNLRRRNIGIGISIDGPPEINDNQRGNTRRDITKKIIQGIENLIEAGYSMDEIGAISVLTNRSIGKENEILNYLVNTLNFTSISLNPAITTDQRITPKPEIAAKSLYSAFRYIISLLRDHGKLVVFSPIVELLMNLLFGKSTSICYNLNGCYGGLTMLAFDTEGNIYPCPEVVGKKNFILGNVRELNKKSIELVLSEIYLKIRQVRREYGKKYILGKGFTCYFEQSIVGDSYLRKFYETLSWNLLRYILEEPTVVEYLEKYMSNHL